jgi:hypothetical protein
MSTFRQNLKNEAAQYFVLKDLFPKSNFDNRRKLTDYQAKKISRALREFKIEHAEDLHRMTPIKRGRKEYLKEHEQPSYYIGTFLSGGRKVNTDVKYTGGELQYNRKGSPRARSNDLDTSSDDEAFIKSAKEVLKRRKGRKAGITAGGKVIGAVIPTRENDLIIKEGLRIFNKYGWAFDGKLSEQEIQKYNLTEINGQIYRERRYGNGVPYLQKVAHPSEWGMAIYFEGKIEEKPKKKGKKK